MTNIQRNIGIIGDGPTDRKIFGAMVKSILTEDTDLIDCNIVELQRQNIHDFVEKYINLQEKNLSVNRQNLVKSIGAVILAGFEELLNEVTNNISASDLIIVTTDSEIVFSQPENYWERGANLFHILIDAVNWFYEIALNRGYPQDNIPLVLPLITFPSTEIIIAAARGLNTVDFYSKKPIELKNLLYNLSKDGRVSDRHLEEQALNFLNVRGIEKIFQYIPESRYLIKCLSAYQVSSSL
jgi:hypothetical protein